jgi:hypothetical protein
MYVYHSTALTCLQEKLLQEEALADLQRKVEELTAENELRALVLEESEQYTDKNEREEMRKELTQAMATLHSLVLKRDNALERLHTVQHTYDELQRYIGDTIQAINKTQEDPKPVDSSNLRSPSLSNRSQLPLTPSKRLEEENRDLRSALSQVYSSLNVLSSQNEDYTSILKDLGELRDHIKEDLLSRSAVQETEEVSHSVAILAEENAQLRRSVEQLTHELVNSRYR